MLAASQKGVKAAFSILHQLEKEALSSSSTGEQRRATTQILQETKIELALMDMALRQDLWRALSTYLGNSDVPDARKIEIVSHAVRILKNDDSK